MAITITAYSFSKRSNSTARPTASGTDFSVSLKDRCSYDRPTFLLNHSGTFSYNYIVWGTWYYFVTDVTIERTDLISVTCDIDVLATYKTEIGNTSAFVLYDTAANTELRDTRLALKDTAVYSSSTVASTIFSNSYTTVMLSVVGQYSSKVYGVIPSTVDALLDDVNPWHTDIDNPNKLPYTTIDPGDIDPSDPDSLIEAIIELGQLFKVFVNNLTAAARQKLSTGSAPDCIRSAILLPMSAMSFTILNEEDIWLGEYFTGVQGRPMQFDAHATETVTISIPWQFSDWRNGAQCTQVFVFLPYCGSIQISTDILRGASSIVVICNVSTGGEISYILTATDSGLHTAYIGTFKGNCGSPYRVGRSAVTPVAQAAAVSSGIGGLAAMGALGLGGAGAIAAGAAGLMGMAHNMQPTTTMIGGVGGSAYTSPSNYGCYCVTHDTAADPTSLSAAIGTPTMSVKQINTLSGYVQTKCFSVNAACEEPIRQRINNLMDGGIYYE